MYLRGALGLQRHGIYLSGPGLVYVGQPADAKRRLRDLPIGESHHLATTVPPEIWERVVVAQWPSLLAQMSTDAGDVIDELGQFTCGLAIEYLFQLAYRPLLNARRRSSVSDWSARNVESSQSRGAVASSQITALFRLVRAQWDDLATAHGDDNKGPAVYADGGRMIFPGRDLHAASTSIDKERNE